MSPKTPSEYISQAPKETQKKLKELRAILKSVTPKGATEEIKWRVPVFALHRILFAYAGYKTHVSFTTTPVSLNAFKKDLEKYKTGKGAIQFPLDKPLPKSLIQKIAKYRIKDLVENDARWM